LFSLQNPNSVTPNSLAKSTDKVDGAETAPSIGIFAANIFDTIS